MEKVRPWCGQPSDRGRLKNRKEQNNCSNVFLAALVPKLAEGLHGPDPQTRPAFHKFDEEVLMWWISLSRLLLSGARFSKLLKIFLSSS